MSDLTTTQLAAIESRTQEIGRYIFDHLVSAPAGLLQRRWWDEQVLNWAMRDEQLKTQLFRFVDVLPTLKEPDAVVTHLHEYLNDVKTRIPTPVRVALGLSRWASLTRTAAAKVVHLATEDLAKRFIAGTNTPEVLAAAWRERQCKRTFTLDILGEAVTSEREADQFCQAYIQLLQGVSPAVNKWPDDPLLDRDSHGPIPRCNVSIKLSALDCRFDAIDPEGTLKRTGARLRELFRVARKERAFINVDMESYEKKNLTLEIFCRVLSEDEFRDWADVGIVSQCYLTENDRDLRRLVDWARQRGTPIWVRLVKGAYWDYETILARSNHWPVPVYQQKQQSDASFERATRFMLANAKFVRTALGTHNVRSLAHGIAAAEQLGMPREDLEIQMLFGMGDAEKDAVVSLGQRMRIYMPYGDLIPGMAYLVRRLLENTSNNSFLRAGFVEHRPVDELLRAPAPSSGNLESGDATSHIQTSQPNPSPTENRTVHAMFKNQPPVDFSKDQNRSSMRLALREVLTQLGQYYPLVIGGEHVDTPARIASRDPSYCQRLVGECASAELTHVEQAVNAAKSAFPTWRDSGMEFRADFLRRAAAAMRTRLFELAAWEVFECGKGWREATADVDEAIDFCEYYALAAQELHLTLAVNVPGEENSIEYSPRGLVVVIAPWNFPLAILTGMTTAALVTGNCVIMKPAEQSSVVAAKLQEIFDELELPAGVLNYLPGPGEVVGDALVTHPETAVIAFTGSQSVGLTINRRAAETSAKSKPFVKRVIAEMGGKNAIIVDADADLDEAVLAVVKSAFGYQGQKCSACSRAIVLDSIHDAFVTRLVDATRSLSIGPAENAATSVGPVIDESSRERVLEYVNVGRRDSREVLAVDVGHLRDQGYFVGPHIFCDVIPNSRLAQEEIFGPVLAVIRVANLDDAFSVANGTDFALTGGIFSRSPATLERARREFNVGNLYLNRPITGALVGRQPFGGFKMSGIGSKAGGPDYLLQFVVPRTITENTMRRGFAPAAE